MAATDSIDVELFHQADILFHALDRNRTTLVHIMLMAVDTLDQDGFPVDMQHTLLDLHLPEAEGADKGFGHTALFVQGVDDQTIEMGRLGCPTLYTREELLEREQGVLRLHGFQPGRSTQGILLIQYLQLDGGPLHGLPAIQPDAHIQMTILILVLQVGTDLEILNAYFRAGHQLHTSFNATIFPIVLSLQIGTVAIPIDLHGQFVRSFL